MATNLEDLIAKFSDSSEFLHSLEVTDIPSLKEAAKNQWKLAVQNSDKLALNVVEFYDSDRRSEDSMRIIPLGVALQMVREMEEALIEKTVLDPLDIYQATIAKKASAIKFWQTGIFDVSKWWDTLKVLKEIATHAEVSMVRIFLYVFDIAAAANIGKTVAKVLLQRQAFETKMRKRALPAPKGNVRWPRRKVAR